MADSDAAGTWGGEAGVVAAALREAGWENAHCLAVSALSCPEPVVAVCGEWRRESRQADGSVRGIREVTLVACCDDPHDAEATCLGAAIDLEGVDWTRATCPEGLRVVDVDIGVPSPAGRDGSGRWLWELPLEMTCVRSPRAGALL